MWKNQSDKEMWNPSWRKLLCRSQIGVSAFQTSSCRRENGVVICSVGLSQCSLKLRNIWDFWALYIYGKWVHLCLNSLTPPLRVFIHINHPWYYQNRLHAFFYPTNFNKNTWQQCGNMKIWKIFDNIGYRYNRVCQIKRLRMQLYA